jgi:hypothetical protein
MNDKSETPTPARGNPRESTPATDLQPEDAGTAASGNEAQPAMKQEHKTNEESGSGGREGSR